MAIAIAITGIIVNGSNYSSGSASAVADFTANEIIVDCTLTLSGNYGTAASHGDLLDFTTVNPSFSFGGEAPSDWNIHELVAAGVALTGFTFSYCPGPTLAAPTQKGGVL